MKFLRARRGSTLLAAMVLAGGSCLAQKDPGVRGGVAGAGGTFHPIDNSNAAANQADQDFFLQTLERFQEVNSVSGTVEPGNGLGPAFNLNSCGACHVQPAIGGSSPAVNPQVKNKDGSAFAHLDGASNPADTTHFLSANGPIREVRFILNPDGSLDGGVHDIFSIAGRTDAPGCTLQQPNFDQEITNHNAIFRIPIAVFGDGLVEMVSDAFLRDNLASTATKRAALGIGGRFNTNGNDGTITRFGWKAQNKSLLLFAGEAYNVEQGVTNNLFQSDRFPQGTSDATVTACTFNTSPEDTVNTINSQANTIVGGVSKANPNLNKPVGTASEMASDMSNFAAFMQLLAPPTAVTTTASQLNGLALFKQIGCALCHSQTLTTNQLNGVGGNGNNTLFAALGGVSFQPFSDFAIHHMGSTLADGVNQGAAGPDEFRTAPLWGLGQRIFFLHDGRTSDLLETINAHSSSNDCVITASYEQFVREPGENFYQPFSQSTVCGSEANQVIEAFSDLSATQKQDLLNFLRSL
ncbi:MAG TPA: di-heme oxidoredictase family protein [Bryobacteraceae bacterium]|nr:di-heme oxidoredictase family protein [Bryobacteraceae bacterium]